MKPLLGALIVVGFIAAYWQLALAVLLGVLAVNALVVFGRRRQSHLAASRERHRALIARADQQHAWASAGDPRGTFGNYAPG